MDVPIPNCALRWSLAIASCSLLLRSTSGRSTATVIIFSFQLKLYLPLFIQCVEWFCTHIRGWGNVWGWASAFRSAIVYRVFSYRSPGLRSSERNEVDVQTDFLSLIYWRFSTSFNSREGIVHSVTPRLSHSIFEATTEVWTQLKITIFSFGRL